MNQATPAKQPKPSLEQQRSQAAWKMAQVGVNSQAGKKYTNLAKAAPALIMQNGLLQTLAFYESKNEEQHKQLSGHLRRWISLRLNGIDKDQGFSPLAEALLGSNSADYRLATQEALLLLRWLRQFAAALGD